MTRPLRLLLTSPPSSSHPPPPPPPPPPALEQLNSDFVVILAALLCALICLLGLVGVARCAWLRRFANQHRPPPPPAAANKGLKKKVLRSLPTQPYAPHFEQADCAICLAEFAEGDQLRVLPQCGHGFHVACIDTWLGSHSSCPSCRQILVVGRCRKCGKCGGVPPESGASGSSEVRRKESEDGAAQLPQYLP